MAYFGSKRKGLLNGYHSPMSGGLIEDIFGHDLTDAARAGKSTGQLTGAAKPPAASGPSLLDKLFGGLAKGVDIYGQYKAGGQPVSPDYAQTPQGSSGISPLLLIGAVGVGAYLMLRRRK